MITDDQIEEIKSRADIVDVVGDHVQLRKRGMNYLGLCPFHNEKTPSFTVSPDKGIFHCFGCGKGGNVYTFLMNHEGMEFPEAVRTLAERYGVKIEESRGRDSSSDRSEKENIVEINRMALKFFRESFEGETGKAAREYMEGRGFLGDISDSFRVGFAPDSWDGLTNYLKKNNVEMALAYKAGLVGKKEERYYDKFRSRVIFPITDALGKLIAFGGRILGEGEPKYLNSPETPTFRKSDVLYGLYKAKDEIKKKGYVLVSEGYFDCIALYNGGFTNSVATMGTALTELHLRRLKRLGADIYTIFDSDEAGKKAALRGLDNFIKEEVTAKVVLLPNGMDPDDLLKQDGPEALTKLIDEARPAMEFFLDDVKSSVDMNSAEGKGRYSKEALPMLSKIKNLGERSHYLSVIAKDIGTTQDELLRELKKLGKGRVEIEEKPTRRVESHSGGDDAEAIMLTVLMRNPELYDKNVEDALRLFEEPLYVSAANLMIEFFAKGESDTAKLANTSPDEKVGSFLTSALIKDESGFMEESDTERILKDCMEKVLTPSGVKAGKKELLKKLEESGRKDLADEIMK
ncbi:MAG: DNA primase [Deltaproteobacteria bacterium]|nr:DNA primase [Deltaproteobacteria bacterium]